MRIPAFIINAQNKVVSMPRKKLALIGGGFVIFIVLMNMLFGGEDTAPAAQKAVPTVQAMEIRPGLQRTFSVTGEVTANQSATITAEFRATVKEIKARVGDDITPETVLIALDSASVSDQYRTANLSYASAVQNLAQTQLQAEKNIQSAEIALKLAESNLDTIRKQNDAQRFQAEEKLKSTRLNTDLSVTAAETNLNSAIQSVRNTAETAMIAVDKLLELSPAYRDLTYINETHIGVRDTVQKNQTEDALRDSYNALNSYTPTYDNALKLIETVKLTVQNMLITLQNSTTSTQYTDADLQADIAVMTGHNSTLITSSSNLQSKKDALDSAKQTVGSESQININAQKEYNSTIAQLDGAERKAEINVEEAQAALENARAGAGISQISARTNLTNVAGQLSQTRISADKQSVRSPFEGTITDIAVRDGDEVQPGDPLVSIENDDLLKIVASLSADEVRSVRVGDMVSINGESTARVATISPSADPVTKKYSVEILHRDDTLRSGEFVRLTFVAEQIDDERIFVPISSVIVQSTETFVWSLTQSGSIDIATNTPVVIGELQGSYVEIRSGLDEGDFIVSTGARTIDRDGTEVHVTLPE